jgi:ATP-dependent DNA helicase RecQ
MSEPEKRTGPVSGKFEILKDVFGYTVFRGRQEEVIDAIVSGRDVLAVMPTGAGKSLCYQIPSLMFTGLTLVISPLISLMKDQVNSLREAGVEAALLNSSLSPREYAETLRRAAAGVYRLLYVAPERLLSGAIRRFTGTNLISLVAVDEAHCLSQWGHDFRPSYLEIAPFIQSFRERPVTAAFTATATPKVREDILKGLDLRDPLSLTTGFDRENLYFEVQKPADKTTALLKFLSGHRERSGIVYCSTRKTVEELHSLLLSRGFASVRYHAGLEDRERRENQDDFLYDRKTVMVATNAFGMGIDKSNVSFVVHYNMPKNIESYYQEAGRAGRDGEGAECVLLYSGEDVRINQYLITRGREGDSPADRWNGTAGRSGTATRDMTAHNLELLKSMTFYATGQDCLRFKLLSYFGENPPAYCGNCSNCNTRFENRDITLEAKKIISCVYRLKQRGRRFGRAMIIDILRGSKNEKIRRFGLESLSTWGIMSGTDGHTLRTIVDYLIEKKYLALEGDEYPVVEATGLSGEIIFENRRLSMMLPKEPKEQKPARSVPDREEALDDETLFLKLKELRRTLAAEASLPAYIVFPDASLRDMCRRIPRNIEAFKEVTGVGAFKTEKYGAAFVSLIDGYIRETRGGE